MKVPITRERLNSPDHYRFQVQPKNKLAQAIGHNFLLEHLDNGMANHLRDKLAGAIESEYVSALKVVTATESGRWALRDWMQQNIPEMEMLEKALAWLDSQGVSIQVTDNNDSFRLTSE